ncbi:YybH family protein [Planctomyces sp. SH-PL62]|uniref:YybH family protein n=1 Tax=Planctomyces sp. SH-PL62 TaxID=1636152 RepID=UPI00078C4051|nr:SgcJ/EcaC family oxidoreductase [Planctomyces sp. SH-PL62]AMV40685.1 RNA polymerase factor sigma-70 [Planctomyces sp. SH-PL62]
MNRVASICLLIASACVPALGQTPSKEDDAAVRDLVRRYVDAREARDAKAVEALLTADADQLVSDGTWRRGRDSLVQGMLESSRKNPAKRTIEVESVRLLAPDAALADGRYLQVGAALADVRAMWTTIVARRTPEGWKIAAIRNMLPAPAAPAGK